MEPPPIMEVEVAPTNATKKSKLMAAKEGQNAQPTPPQAELGIGQPRLLPPPPLAKTNTTALLQPRSRSAHLATFTGCVETLQATRAIGVLRLRGTEPATHTIHQAQ
jgi:hypothetical protein